MNAPPPATTFLTPRSELTIRLVATITLVPVVAGLAGIVTALVPSPPVRDQFFLYFVLVTVGGVGAGVVIWRSYVRWTRTRVAGTLLLKGLLLAHLIAWTPLWDAGCMSDGVTASQCISLLGLAVPSAVLLWWGGLRLLRRGQTSVPSSARGRKLMSVTAVRILLALALTPFLFGLWYFLVFFSDHLGLGTTEGVLVAHLSCAVLLVGVWWLIWRPALPRGRRVGLWTALSAVVYVVLVAVAAPGFEHDSDVVRVLAGVTLPVASGIWLMATAWLFCARAPLSSAGFDLDRLACPSCGYSLVGLHEVRCPECGWRATIDQLFAHCAADPLA